MVIINSKKIPSDKKVYEFVGFMHSELSTMFLRELIIAKTWFEQKSKILFFRKVNEIKQNSLHEIQKLSWDFTLIRFIENMYQHKPNPKADFFIPYFLTFDKPFSEIIDLYPLKAILIINKLKRFHAIPLINKEEVFKNTNTESFFDKEMSTQRLLNRSKVRLDQVILKTEKELMNIIELKNKRSE
jgi:hypothetical protein